MEAIGNRLFSALCAIRGQFGPDPWIVRQSGFVRSRNCSFLSVFLVFELRTVREFLRTVRRLFFAKTQSRSRKLVFLIFVQRTVRGYCSRLHSTVADSPWYCSGLSGVRGQSASSVLCAVCSFEFQIAFYLLRWVSILPRTLFVLLSRVGLGNFASEISFALEVILGQQSNISKEI